MYKTVYIDYMQGGYEIQTGNVRQLERIINEWKTSGYEFVSMTAVPSPIESSNCNFVLIFKSEV
ncbi:MAG: hypothetical protein IJD48_03905 [Clostridia bacterium]|nr:hypothetical protein [Clostridia bacterium]